MTKRSPGTKTDIAEETIEVSKGNRRDFVIKVRVNETEKEEIDRQKGRLSRSAFMRDRGLNQSKVYDPTYAAIGSVYQSARNVRESAASIENESTYLRNSAEVLASLIGQGAGSARAANAGADLLEIAERLHAQGKQLDHLAKTLGVQARELAEQHMKEMIKRYPATSIQPRKKR